MKILAMEGPNRFLYRNFDRLVLNQVKKAAVNPMKKPEIIAPAICPTVGICSGMQNLKKK